MSSEKATALVLRVIEFSETSSIVTLYSREFGKFSALAKGARRPKGPFESALDLLNLCRVVFLRKSSGTLDLLTEAKLQRRFRGRGRELSFLYAGYYVAELLKELNDEYDPNPALFDAADETLEALATEGSLVALVLRFELTALRLLGHMPSLALCVNCGCSVEPSPRVSFGLLAGGVLCTDCRPGHSNVVSVSAGVIRVLERFADPDSEAWRTMEIDRRTAGELRGVLNSYLSHLLGHRPRMHSYLSALSGST